MKFCGCAGWIVTIVVASHGGAAHSETQTNQSSIDVDGPIAWRVQRVPDELMVTHSEDKRGTYHPWRDFPHEMTRYNHVNPLTDKLNHLKVVGLDEAHLMRGRKVGWGMSIRAEDGDAVCLAGQIYRWDASQKKLIRVPLHTLEIPQARGMRRFVIHGVQGSIAFGANSAMPRLHLVLLEFEDPEDEAAKPRVKLQITQMLGEKSLGAENITAPERDALEQLPGSTIVNTWLAEGSHITTKDWDVELKRIIPPDPERGIIGWADFYLNPDPPTEKR